MTTKWICSQLGAREKYAVPRAVRNKLIALYTDIWAPPHSLASMFNKRLAGRYHPDLKNAPVTHFTIPIVTRKIREKVTGKPVPLDRLFDSLVQEELLRMVHPGKITFFGYSYSTRLSMKAAKTLGYTTVLGQINPGPAEASIVREEFKKYKSGAYQPTVPDEWYWDRWREEIELADTIIVNSSWSLQLLKAAGVPAEKCMVLPLAYEPPEEFGERKFRQVFDYSSPMRLLYLGGIGIRKGFHILAEAMRLLASHPVRLDVVGVLKGPEELIKDLPPNITLHGAVPGNTVGEYYKRADLFIFPTLSDGFGLTQLEAQAYRLPLITTRYCAEVITDGVNGLVLEKVDAESIRDAVLNVLEQPGLLATFSANAVPMEKYNIEKLSGQLSLIE